jgi:hypothetical protein
MASTHYSYHEERTNRLLAIKDKPINVYSYHSDINPDADEDHTPPVVFNAIGMFGFRILKREGFEYYPKYNSIFNRMGAASKKTSDRLVFELYLFGKVYVLSLRTKRYI